MTVHVITMVPSQLPKNDLELTVSPLIQNIREALKKKGGEPVMPILMGDATLFESQALEPLLGPFDVLVTRHRSIGAYNKAMEVDEYKQITKGKEILTFGFANNTIYIDWLLPAMKQMYGLLGHKIDTESKIFVRSGGKVEYSLFQANGDRGLENYKRRVGHYPNRAFYMIDLCTKKETPDGKADDIEHTKGWHQAAFSTDVQTLFGGKVVSLDKGPKIFREVVIYKFSSRELFVDMMESDYYVELAQLQERLILDRFVELCLPVY